MMLFGSNYVAFNFAGHVIEGLDGKIYCFDPYDAGLFRLENNRLVFVKRIFDDYLFNAITGRGYVARRRRENRHAVRICTIPPTFSRLIYIPQSVFIGYNADRKIAVLRDGTSSNLICVDFSVRPAKYTSLDMVCTAHDNINMDRMLVATHDYNSGVVKIYDLLKKDYVLETETEHKAYFVYPVSEDTLAVVCGESFSVVKQGEVVFRGDRLCLHDIRSVGDRVLISCWSERWPLSYYYVYVNTKTGRRCLIFDCADTVLLSGSVAIRGAVGHGWFVVPDEYLEEKHENLVFAGQLYRSDVFTSYSPTI